MKLREFFSAEAVELDLQADTKDEALKELVSLL
jgi:mannitol/fructose-specific phosphotransferase system IIA component (Ntr-type)